MTENLDEHLEDAEAVCVAPDVGSNDVSEVSAEVRGAVSAVDRKPLKINLAALNSYVQELASICEQMGVAAIRYTITILGSILGC